MSPGRRETGDGRGEIGLAAQDPNLPELFPDAGDEDDQAVLNGKADIPSSRLPSPVSRLAEVAVPLYVRQTYTYRLPEALAEAARPGCRALVPFGRKVVTGYVVAIHEQLDEAVDPA